MDEQVEQWARESFGDCALGDRRRTNRLVRIAAAAASRPAGAVTGAILNAAEREAAYRFIESSAISPSAIGAAIFRASARACASSTQVVVAVDQSTVSVTDNSGKGFGRTSTSFAKRGRRGCQVMSALALDSEGVTTGLLGQEWRIRSDERSPGWHADTRPIDDRESGLWMRCIRSAYEHLKREAPQTRAWFQLDRGADATHVLAALCKLDADFTVRSAYDRCLEHRAALRKTLEAEPCLGSVAVAIPVHHAGSGVPRTRAATLAITAKRVTLHQTRSKKEARKLGALSVTAVHVREISGGEHPHVEWYLLTNVDVHSLEQALEVIRNYRKRWRVEEFHRAWKSGVCNVEDSQLRSVDALRRWSTILAAVATRAERLKTQSRLEPDVDATTELSRDEIDAAIMLTKTKLHKVGDALTLHQAVNLVALMGGYTGKSSGGPPGAVVIARGLERVIIGAQMLLQIRLRSG